MKLFIAGGFAFSGAALAAKIAPVSYHDGSSFEMMAGIFL
jgi:hypothetical protein